MDSLNYFLWSARKTSDKDFVEHCGSNECFYIICLRMDYKHSFVERLENNKLSTFNRPYLDFSMKMTFPVNFSAAEILTMQVGKLNINRGFIYREVNSGHYMRLFHIWRHYSEPKDEHFMRAYIADRDYLLQTAVQGTGTSSFDF